MSACLFDLLFSPTLDPDEIGVFRRELAGLIVRENAVIGEENQWVYVADCVAADYACAPIPIQILVILQACAIHKCMRTSILKQAPENAYLPIYLEFLEWTMEDFAASDPIENGEVWKEVFASLKNAWLLQMAPRPWNSATTRTPETVNLSASTMGKKRSRPSNTPDKRRKTYHYLDAVGHGVDLTGHRNAKLAQLTATARVKAGVHNPGRVLKALHVVTKLCDLLLGDDAAFVFALDAVQLLKLGLAIGVAVHLGGHLHLPAGLVAGAQVLNVGTAFGVRVGATDFADLLHVDLIDERPALEGAPKQTTHEGVDLALGRGGGEHRGAVLHEDGHEQVLVGLATDEHVLIDEENLTVEASAFLEGELVGEGIETGTYKASRLTGGYNNAGWETGVGNDCVGNRAHHRAGAVDRGDCAVQPARHSSLL